MSDKTPRQDYDDTRDYLVADLPNVKKDADELAKTKPELAKGILQTAVLRATKPTLLAE